MSYNYEGNYTTMTFMNGDSQITLNYYGSVDNYVALYDVSHVGTTITKLTEVREAGSVHLTEPASIKSIGLDFGSSAYMLDDDVVCYYIGSVSRTYTPSELCAVSSAND